MVFFDNKLILQYCSSFVETTKFVKKKIDPLESDGFVIDNITTLREDKNHTTAYTNKLSSILRHLHIINLCMLPTSGVPSLLTDLNLMARPGSYNKERKPLTFILVIMSFYSELHKNVNWTSIA